MMTNEAHQLNTTAQAHQLNTTAQAHQLNTTAQAFQGFQSNYCEQVLQVACLATTSIYMNNQWHHWYYD